MRNFTNTFSSAEHLNQHIQNELIQNQELFELKDSLITFEFNSDVLNLPKNHKIVFNDVNFENNIVLDNSTFNERVEFNNCRVSRFSALNCTFKKNLVMCSTTAGAKFDGSEFQDAVHLPSSSSSISFESCVFREFQDFSETHFNHGINLVKTIFQKGVDFSETTFNGKVEAWDMISNGDLIFRWANFNQKVTITKLKIPKYKVDFYGASFKENGYLYNLDCKRIDLKKTVIDEGLFFLDSKIKRIKRESARIIKNEFLRQNNKIESLSYHKREMTAYLVESISNIFRLKQFFNSIGNSVILILNLITNIYGTSWFMALIFFCCASLKAYDMFYHSLSIKTNIDYYNNYFLFLNPTHSIDFISETNFGTNTYKLDFAGRIIISFAIFQFVQAFRKFGKN